VKTIWLERVFWLILAGSQCMMILEQNRLIHAKDEIIRAYHDMVGEALK
jgi:hypothetical protein